MPFKAIWGASPNPTHNSLLTILSIPYIACAVESELLSIETPEAQAEAVARAAAVLRGGGVVAVPTETVYGLAANALDEAAVANNFSNLAKRHDATLDATVEDGELKKVDIKMGVKMEAVGKYIGTQLAAEKSVLADLLTSDPEPVTIVIDDALGETVDVIGYNEYLGWYMSPFIAQGLREQGFEVEEAEVRERVLASLPLFRIETAFGKPLIISEFGAGARQGRRGGPVEIWSEDYQARVYARQLEFLAKSPSIRGISPWILKDFRAPYRLNVPVQDYWNRKGLVSETGQKKRAFGVLSDHYAERAGR